MRTHYCGRISSELTGQRVTLCGWVHRCRDLGGVIFINLRDREGIVQVIVRPERKDVFQTAETLHNEYIIQVTGIVTARPPDMINTAMETGSVEIESESITLLCAAETPPFPVDQYVPVNDDLRLKYRYIDLRRSEMTHNIKRVARLARAIREYLDHHDFLEIETPFLTKATPEGARDYLVPSRVHPGHFYALPQSPQLFKQILMMAGMDRYYQIVRCFRDEDLRADRQPEFTQLDLEMSFVDERLIQDTIEEMMHFIFKKTMDITLPPFERMTYQEAVQRFGSDKPDLRNPLELVELTDLLAHTSFPPFSAVASDSEGRIAGIRVPQGASLSRKQIETYGQWVTAFGAKGLFSIKVNHWDGHLSGLQSSLIKFLDENVVRELVARMKAQTGDLLLIGADKKKVVTGALGALRVKLGEELQLLSHDWRPLWVTDFPMFEQVNGQWVSSHHPFTAPSNPDIESMKKDPGNSLSRAWDMVINGYEIGSGSMRIYDIQLQMAVFHLLGIGEREAQEKFGFLLEAMKYGCPPIGGMGIGFGRIAMLMSGAKSLRDVVAFPKTTTASCPLTDAPSAVSRAQLDELKINIQEI